MVSWLGLFHLAFANLKINKFRSCLTILGMVFGTGAVIATLSSNEGAARHIKGELDKMGTNVVVVRPDANNEKTVDTQDRDLLSKYSDLFKTLSLVHSLDGIQLRFDSVVKETKVIGVDTAYFEAVRINLESGRYFDNEENHSAKPVGVIGREMKEALFGKGNAIGRYVYAYVKNVPFTFQIVGVLEKRGGPAGEVSDHAFFIPANTAKKLSLKKNHDTILAGTLYEDEKSVEARLLVESLLAKRFPSGLKISDAREQIERTKGIWEKQNLLGICLALISLLTGGVGIMNIMLLSVVQRRKEIGLRKAVGANDGHILTQFLLESVTICLFGGILGIAVGLLFGQRVAAMMGNWKAVVSLSTVALAMGFSVLTGVLFGLVPAYRAAKMDPYEALRA